MRLFLETSSLLKVLLREDLSDLAREAFFQAQVHATSAFALPEAVGVLHAMQRDGRLTRPLYHKSLRGLYELWEYLEVLTPTLEGHMRAARLCERHPLKGADAVHLEGALFLRGLYPDTTFLTFDRTLYAGRQEGGPDCGEGTSSGREGLTLRPSLPQADRGARVHPHLHGANPRGNGHPALPPGAHPGGLHLEAPPRPR
ncbi:type II toxin-antitoxin system VapC family toxin [Thermus igniterrae]|uniref:type II toxin-antitoxin system VapC family toxin n=1 Tax=Thermus igniterrae TaxID=88189 RepID=UPI00035F04DB|nr:type II toxin-antitoxin system VapC family toxin [Thermus igniterrae]